MSKKITRLRRVDKVQVGGYQEEEEEALGCLYLVIYTDMIL